jgi:dTDP-4-dehydrorhamnose 3,5-epimerase
MPITTHQTSLAGVTLIQPSTFEDHRGTYVETYNVSDYVANGIEVEFVRDDISTSSKHVLRGIHYDNKTWKLIQCMEGRIYFVVVDMRPDSSQYLKWQSFVLSSENRTQILVPPGFANGHLVLSDKCIFHYKMSEYYDPENEKILRWDDPRVGIFWPVKDPQLSMKDSEAKLLG